MIWIDGFVMLEPEARRADYVAMAERVGQIFLDHGASRIVESWGATSRTAKSPISIARSRPSRGRASCFR